MKTIIQFIKARLGLWKPKIGEIYRADTDKDRDPFYNDGRWNVKVLDVKDGYVKYGYVGYTEHIRSGSIDGFACFWIKVK